MKHKLSALLLLMAAVCLLSGCKRNKHEPVDLTSIHTSKAAAETMASSIAKQEETTTASEETTTKAPSANAAQIASEIQSYHPGDQENITISYPIISNMKDSGNEEEVNKLLKENASAFYHSLGEDNIPDSMNIKCSVESLDRNRITAVYKGVYTPKGGSYPINVFYTNTVDLQQVKSLGINDYSDAYTMAGYLMSEDVEFYQVSDGLKNSLLAHRAAQTIEDYTNLLNEADFPLKTSDSGKEFPGSFSYLNQSTLYFSIPVPHELGDYAIVTIPIDGK